MFEGCTSFKWICTYCARFMGVAFRLGVGLGRERDHAKPLVFA